MIGDVRALIISALRTTAASPLVGGRFGTRLGDTYPQVRVTLLSGPPRRVAGIYQPEYQLECWGNGSLPEDERAAWAVANAVEDAVTNRLLVGTFPAGTITGCYMSGYILHSPDPQTARERFIVTAGVLARENSAPA